jgi:two-component system, LytTR family, response regulator
MKDNISTLIIDDERLARNKLRLLLSKYPRFNITGEAKNVSDAIVKIREFSPDVVFLDIQMPGGSGFDLLDQIDYKGKIIFVTAFDEYAIRAFHVNALDYLLKPVSPERLDQSIQRLISGFDQDKPKRGMLQYEDKLFVSIRNCYKFISLDKVKVIKALGDYSQCIIDGNSNGIILRSMKEWEEKLPQNHFVRIHRSFIVNMNYIERIEKSGDYNLKAWVKGFEEPLNVSKSYRKIIKSRYQ